MIIFENIYKYYGSGDAQTTALNGVSGSINAGEIVALCGPSGSGKSTLLNIVGLLDSSYSGTLILDGEKINQDVKTLTEIRRSKVGFIFQSYNLNPVMTAYENIEYPLLLSNVPSKERKLRINELLDVIGLAEHAKKRPDQMSGGQQQRVAIARALVKRPSLVIADEPTANLDTSTANNIVGVMKSLGQESNTTFLVATHDERMSNQCSHVIRMQDGKMVGEKTGVRKTPKNVYEVNFQPTASCIGGPHHAMD